MKNMDLPVSWMQFISFRFCKLHHDGKTHDNCPFQRNSFLDKVYGPELNVTNTRGSSIKRKSTSNETTYPLERLDSLSVTILESMTVFSPNLSSKK